MRLSGKIKNCENNKKGATSAYRFIQTNKQSREILSVFMSNNANNNKSQSQNDQRAFAEHSTQAHTHMT